MENSLSILIFRLNHRLNEKLSPLRNELGLSKGQPKILRYVFHHDGCSQVAIADYYDLSPATVSGLLDGLAKNDLIERQSGENRRCFKICITNKGKEVLKSWDEKTDKLLANLLEDFKEEEKVLFSKLLNKAIAALGD